MRCFIPHCITVLIADMRWLKIAHYMWMVLLGVALGIHLYPESLTYYYELALPLLCFGISLVFAALFAIIHNNIADVAIDAVNHPHRPLQKQAIALNHYLGISYVAFIISLAFACACSHTTTYAILIVMALYHGYSTPPLRLKRFLFISKAILAVNTYILFLAGFLLVQPNLALFPAIITPFFLLGVTLSASLIDLNDVKGDWQGNIKTLPLVLGQRNCKLLIGLSLMLTYTFTFFFLSKTAPCLWLTLAGLCIVQIALVTTRTFHEVPFFITHLLTLTCLISIMLT
ncbi:MAG: UbiA family prenyltransferase [Gammaproteobacteria bacterium]|nr:UbiA family prenyltransferase [Gammaproteobacteria bacterium]